MKNFFYTLVFLILASPVASEVSFARLLNEGSFAKDRFFGGIEINLKLTQGVPYKMNFLEEPISLIIDFSTVQFDEIDLRKLNRSKNIELIKVKQLDSKWSRLSIQFKDYWNIDNTEMRINPSDGSAIISILLKSVSEDIFKSKNVISTSILKSKNLEAIAKSPVIENNEFVVVLDPGHGGKDPGAEAGGYRESNLMLELAVAVKESLIRNTDFKVI